MQRFAKILTFKTVSNVHEPKHVQHPDEFRKLHAWLADTFPDVWSKLEVTVVSSGAVLLAHHVQGASSDVRQLKQGRAVNPATGRGVKITNSHA